LNSSERLVPLRGAGSQSGGHNADGNSAKRVQLTQLQSVTFMPRLFLSETKDLVLLATGSGDGLETRARANCDISATPWDQKLSKRVETHTRL
jgi:hypothetical protein